jgi:hypothetical protein
LRAVRGRVCVSVAHVKVSPLSSKCSPEQGSPTSHKQQATSNKPQATSHKQQATSCKQQATSCKQQATSNKQQATSHKQQATSNKQQATSCKPHAPLRSPARPGRPSRPQRPSRHPREPGCRTRPWLQSPAVSGPGPAAHLAVCQCVSVSVSVCQCIGVSVCPKVAVLNMRGHSSHVWDRRGSNGAGCPVHEIQTRPRNNPRIELHPHQTHTVPRLETQLFNPAMFKLTTAQQPSHRPRAENSCPIGILSPTDPKNTLASHSAAPGAAPWKAPAAPRTREKAAPVAKAPSSGVLPARVAR